MTQPVPLKALQRQLKILVDDLREQSRDVAELDSWLREQYTSAFGSRTGATFEDWREEQLDQAAVAWLLGTVFVRFYNEHHWILAAFTHLRDLPATDGIFDDRNPVWRFPISGDAAAALLDFWRRGPGVHSFVDDQLETRFLGDLYEKLSEYARKRYALLQTPEFVEEFILDLVLTPSLTQVDDAYLATLTRAVTGQLGGKVGVATRVFLKKLVADVLDRVELHADFDPQARYQLTLRAAELSSVERNAAGLTVRGVDDIDLNLP